MNYVDVIVHIDNCYDINDVVDSMSNRFYKINEMKLKDKFQFILDENKNPIKYEKILREYLLKHHTETEIPCNSVTTSYGYINYKILNFFTIIMGKKIDKLIPNDQFTLEDYVKYTDHSRYRDICSSVAIAIIKWSNLRKNTKHDIVMTYLIPRFVTRQVVIKEIIKNMGRMEHSINTYVLVMRLFKIVNNNVFCECALIIMSLSDAAIIIDKVLEMASKRIGKLFIKDLMDEYTLSHKRCNRELLIFVKYIKIHPLYFKNYNIKCDKNIYDTLSLLMKHNLNQIDI